MAALQSEFHRLEADISGLHEDWFIETCAEWVIPYIGDLLGVRNLHSVDSAGISSQRAYVANTLRYRRRKGTAPVLEQLARDVTGWPARAVECFERLIATQHVNHVRPHSRTTVNLRDANALELLGGPFETAAHTVEVRRIAIERGKYNIPNIGLFLWRLQPYFVVQSTPRPVADPDDGRYRFSPLGNDMPLFNRPQTETEITHLAEEVNVPGRLRWRALYDDLEALRQALVDEQPHPRSLFLNVDNPAFQVFVGNGAGELTAIPPEEILICDLHDVPGETDWRRPPPSKTYTSRTQVDHSVEPPVPLSEERRIQVAVDPVLGRLTFPAGVVPVRVAVSYAYGFSSDIGGGPYDRRGPIVAPASTETWTRTVAQHDPEANHTTLATALAEWTAGDAADAIITITDSGIYTEAISIAMASQRNLVIQAADGERPTLRLLTNSAPLGELVVGGGDGAEATLTLNGMWIEGGLRIGTNSLKQLCLDHSTLVPGRGLDAASEPSRPGLPSLVAEWPNADLRVVVRRSITGPLHVPEEITDLSVQDSIIHSPLRSGPAYRTPALVSGSLATFPTLTADAPAVRVQIGDEGPHAATFVAKPVTLAQARDQLQAAIRTAHSDSAFQNAIVGNVEDRLVVLPGSAETTVLFGTTEDDPTTLLELGLYADRPVLAGDDIGVQPGPKTTLERVTVFGSVHVREFGLASETIFTGPAVAQRRQVGCTRFCFLPAGSRMPRRYRCQPDLALDEYAQEIGKSTADNLTTTEKEAVLARLTPTFTSARYGDSGYAQLSRTLAEEIRTGAEDGAEMGVFQHLKQPQREANLRASLAEYLRVGLEAGIFSVT
jgi:hypothetical protein